MITIELTSKQNLLLIEMLEGNLSELRMEIADTDSPFYKDKLRERKEEINVLLDTLRSKQKDNT